MLESVMVREFDKFEVHWKKEPDIGTWITRTNIERISFWEMSHSRKRSNLLLPGGHFDREDMAESEIAAFDKFMDFTAQIVEKYGKFFM
ncbi:MAG: hypothetical protein HDR11_11730 [Lachnospiraceae bacterium]|nr:hypothetical protein [Lachnospiraceae bacterium]